MLKKSIILALICILSIPLSYGVSKRYSKDLQKQNQEALQSAEGKSPHERKQILLKKKNEYQNQMLKKQQELYLLRKNKSAPGYKERKQEMKKLEDEIEELHRAQKALR